MISCTRDRINPDSNPISYRARLIDLSLRKTLAYIRYCLNLVNWVTRFSILFLQILLTLLGLKGVQGSDVDAVNRRNQRALENAACSGHEAVVRLLYDAGNPQKTLKLVSF